jgi:hypothetical protein
MQRKFRKDKRMTQDGLVSIASNKRNNLLFPPIKLNVHFNSQLRVLILTGSINRFYKETNVCCLLLI